MVNHTIFVHAHTSHMCHSLITQTLVVVYIPWVSLSAATPPATHYASAKYIRTYKDYANVCMQALLSSKPFRSFCQIPLSSNCMNDQDAVVASAVVWPYLDARNMGRPSSQWLEYMFRTCVTKITVPLDNCLFKELASLASQTVIQSQSGYSAVA